MRANHSRKSFLWCLHGNLQQPDVWTNLADGLQAKVSGLEIQLVDLWETLQGDCWGWAEEFCRTVQSVAMHHANSRHYLLGYSLGGRLAMHALAVMPALWYRAVVVSADVGTADLGQKEQCLRRDRTWANRFLVEPWDDLLREWDSLPVFCGRACTTPRSESAFNRQKIAQAFEAYSKGHMDDLVPHLSQLSMPITYVTGSDDHRYCQLGQILSAQCSSLTHIIVQDAGHRVPWEQPQQLAQILSRVLVG